MINPKQVIYNSHVSLYCPFNVDVNDKTGKSVTNTGVVIRDFATYSIAIPPNNATKGAYFDGNSYLTLSHDAGFDFDAKQFYFGVYIYVISISATTYILSHIMSGSPYTGWLLLLRATGVTFEFNGYSASFSTTLNAGQWYLLEAIGTKFPTNRVRFYLDGVEVSGTPANLNNSSQLQIGARYNNNRFYGYMSGLIIKTGEAVRTTHEIASIRTFSKQNRLI